MALGFLPLPIDYIEVYYLVSKYLEVFSRNLSSADI